MQNNYCIRYRAQIFSMNAPHRPRGHVWSYRQNTDVRYTLDAVIKDFERKNPQYVVGEVVLTFYGVCPVNDVDDVFIEMFDEPELKM